ncbi:laccase [Flagelloscypha sp. PMI_526]|nr:laccase [Flagelloscypha sp. PMI_526]
MLSATVDPDGSGVRRDAIVFQESNTVIGPLIRGNKGDTFQLNVVNNLNSTNMRKSTSIHWHGIFQDGGQEWADGPAFVTQCPIAPQKSFQYQFREPNQAGTFWYHSHLSTQYCDGGRGPFVIYDPQDAYASLYDVDDESTVITIADWYHTYAIDVALVGVPDSALINGLGRYAGTGGTASALAVVSVTQGKRYRLRVINIACDPNYRFSIDGHPELTVIEADGVETVQVKADAVDLFVGQRYSIILNANKTVGNYWIRAGPAGATAFPGGINSAILRYAGAPIADPTTSPNNITNLLKEQSLIPRVSPGAPGPPVRGGTGVKVVNLAFAFNANGDLRFTINNVTWAPYVDDFIESPYPLTESTVPVLLQILSGSKTAAELLPAGSFIEITQGDIVEINLPVPNIAAIGGPHPFHLHGHTFDVIRSAGMTTDNFANPPRRDVVSTGAATDTVTIRFQANNPGPWFLHCHIDWHLELGLALVFVESATQLVSTLKQPAAWDQLCPTYNALADGDK